MKSRKFSLKVLAVVGLGFVSVVNAQQNPLDLNRPLPQGPQSRSNENYRFLKDQSKRTDSFDKYRYHELSDSSWLQVGADARVAHFDSENPFFGLMPGRGLSDSYLQQRLSVHGSLHLLDDQVRVFLQVQNTDSNGQKTLNTNLNRDESGTDISQGFVDVNSKIGDSKLTTRIGRQELVYGVGSLINVGDQRNIRLVFDGAKLMTTTSDGTKLDFFAVRPIINFGLNNGDDKPDSSRNLYGIYATTSFNKNLNVDYYGFLHKLDCKIIGSSCSFQERSGSEERYTIGTRLFGKKDGFDYSGDFMYQFGDHAGADIKAWGVFSNAGYTFSGANQIRLGMNFDVASGGKYSATKTKTFDPMYFRNGAYGEATVNTMSNQIIVGPSLSFSPVQKVIFSGSVAKTYRYSTQDDIYTTNLGTLGTSTAASGKLASAANPLIADDKYIGTNYQASIGWQHSRNLDFLLTYHDFKRGSSIEKLAGSKDIQALVFRTSARF